MISTKYDDLVARFLKKLWKKMKILKNSGTSPPFRVVPLLVVLWNGKNGLFQ